MTISIVDSHVHIFPESHLHTLTWHDPEHPLASQHSVDEYLGAVLSQSIYPENMGKTRLRGFIFVETDRISSVSKDEPGKGWLNALDEISFVARIISGTPIEGEGHRSSDNELCLGFVAWAPVPGGSPLLEDYFTLVHQRLETERLSDRLCGVRYLVQNQPLGVMLQPGFIDGVKWLGRQGLAFDLTVDARTRGLDQLQEALRMIQMVYEDVELKNQTVIVLDHLCKPNLRLQCSPTEIIAESDFVGWSDVIRSMARFPKTYMKLSGCFSELFPLSSTNAYDAKSILKVLWPWIDVVFDAFGPERIMFGSDWPVCNMGGGGNELAWHRWKQIVDIILDVRGCTDIERQGVWGGVALEAYSLKGRHPWRWASTDVSYESNAKDGGKRMMGGHRCGSDCDTA